MYASGAVLTAILPDRAIVDIKSEYWISWSWENGGTDGHAATGLRVSSDCMEQKP